MNLTPGKIVEVALTPNEIIMARITRLDKDGFYFELVLSDWNEQYFMTYDRIVSVPDFPVMNTRIDDGKS